MPVALLCVLCNGRQKWTHRILFYIFLLFSFYFQTDGAEFSVTIVACCPMAGGTSWVYAITVTQPVQTWTVVRSGEDFRALGHAMLAAGLPSVSPCPVMGTGASAVAATDLNTIVQVRNELQGWLSSVLMNPSAHDSPAVNNFLTVGANTCPPQYIGMGWTEFSPLPQSPPSSPSSLSAPVSSCNFGNEYDMEMDDMYIIDDENPLAQPDDQDDDEDYIPAASIRYKPTNEAITDEDEMEIMLSAGEVEMIDDIGSLAQSLGASHLGRSLRLQAETKHPMQFGAMTKPQQGLTIGGPGVVHPAPAVGGIGGAMAQAASLMHFNHKPPVSAPKLDSFKMIKVIGKGSFGKSVTKGCVVLFRPFMVHCLIRHFVIRKPSQEKYFWSKRSERVKFTL